MVVMLLVAVGVSAQNPLIHLQLRFAWLAMSGSKSINQSIKLNRAPGMKHTLTTKTSFSLDCVSVSLDMYGVLYDTRHRLFF